MPLAPILSVRGRGVVVPGDDIDTDRIIPARYLKAITFDALGEGLFHDERWAEDGRPLGHPLDEPARRGASFLLSGRNFGCGSSREHAPQALRRAGFAAVVAASFAEIFFGNATTLGLVCLVLPPAELAALAAAVEGDPAGELELDVAEAAVTLAGRRFRGYLPAPAQKALLAGRYDPLVELLSHRDEVTAVAVRLGYLSEAPA